MELVSFILDAAEGVVRCRSNHSWRNSNSGIKPAVDERVE